MKYLVLQAFLYGGEHQEEGEIIAVVSKEDAATLVAMGRMREATADEIKAKK